jgi:hypothetical protein
MFSSKAVSNWQGSKGEKDPMGFKLERGIDCLMTALSNWGWAFVFNKSAGPRWE